MKSIRTKFCIYLHPKLKLNGVGFMRTFQGSKTFYKCLQMLLLMQFYADKYICTYHIFGLLKILPIHANYHLQSIHNCKFLTKAILSL